MPRELTVEKRQEIRSRTHLIADSLIRVGRAYKDCLTAPNREENKAQEANFADALADFVLFVVESDV